MADADDTPPLLDSRADLEAILRQVADGITVQDVEGTLVYANDAAARLVGFGTAAEFMATPISEVFARFEMFDEDGAPFPLERLPGRLALRGIETEQVIRYRDTRTGSERWSVVRATPVFDEHGAIRFAVNSFRDVTARLLAERDLGFVAEAGQRLNATLNYEETLKTLASLVVPKLASWAGFYLVEEGEVRRMFGAHVDEAKRKLVEETARRHPFDVADRSKPIPLALYEGRSSLFERVTDEALAAAANDEEHFEALKQLGFTTAIVVPLETSGRVIGAMTLVRTEGANYGDADLRVAEELGRRAAVAIENARNFERAQARAHASQALEYVGDGVFLTDAEGVIRLWNPAAAELTGLEAQAVVGLTIPEALPGWPDAQEGGRPQTSPVEVNGRELWLSISRVDFGEGTVYAFRDLTDDRALELLQSDFISTVSHELRTPLAAIYGAAMTVRRGGPGIDERRGELLDVISAEAERLAQDDQRRALGQQARVRDAARLDRELRPRRVARGGRRGRADASPVEPRARAGRHERCPQGRGGPRQGRPGALEPARQRGQVLAGRRCDPAVGRGGRREGAVRGARRRARDPARRAPADLREVLPPRSEPDPRRRRDRARPLHLPRARRPDGRSAERRGQR